MPYAIYGILIKVTRYCEDLFAGHYQRSWNVFRKKQSLVSIKKKHIYLNLFTPFWDPGWREWLLVTPTFRRRSAKQTTWEGGKIERTKKERDPNSVPGGAPSGAVHILLPCSMFHGNKVRWTAEVSQSSCFLGWKFQALRTICLYVHWCIWKSSIRLQPRSCRLVRPAAFL